MSRNQLSTLKISLKGLFLLAILVAGCQEDEAASGCVNATVIDATGLDGCGWMIELLDGSRLEPTNWEDFDLTLVDDLSVCLEYVEANNMASICMAGTIVEITSIAEGTRID